MEKQPVDYKNEIIPIEFKIEDFALEGLRKLSKLLKNHADFEQYLGKPEYGRH